MLSIKKRLKLFILLGCMFFAASMNAATNDDLISLEAEHLSDSIERASHSRDVASLYLRMNNDRLRLEEALEKLLVHLLNDAARFTEKGMIWLKCADLGEYVRFSITDTSNTDAEEDNGRFTDMNINICQSISRLLHGRIWRDTEYTNGIRFIFEIPTNSITDNNTN